MQPAISRETRRLLITIVLSVTALWVLARVRFQDRPVASTPVPDVLAQLRPPSAYGDLARAIGDIRPAIAAAVSTAPGGGAALRIRRDASVTLAPGRADTVLAVNRATGFAIVRHDEGEVPGVMPWVPRVLDYPRYLVAAEPAGASVALRPVFVGGLFREVSALWGGGIWTLPRSTPIEPGTFVFTTDGALAGVAIRHDGGAALVPATLLLSSIERVEQQRGQAGDVGVDIQPLSPAIASAARATTGVVITRLDPTGPAAGVVLPTEIIEAVDGEEMFTVDHWRARIARVVAGDMLTMRVRNAEAVRDVVVTARPLAPAGPPEEDASLGLRLRLIPDVGAGVTSVQPRSRAAAADLRAGDIVTVAGGQRAPTPAQVTRAFGSLPPGGSLLVALTRGSEHRVAVIEK